jgi:hypothetical protein
MQTINEPTRWSERKTQQKREKTSQKQQKSKKKGLKRSFSKFIKKYFSANYHPGP